MHTQSNSYQTILATDGQLAFVLFSYGDVEWGQRSNIGFNSGPNFFMLPEALTPATTEVEEGSNVGTPGLYVYQVDQQTVTQPITDYSETEFHMIQYSLSVNSTTYYSKPSLI